jgi:hypothetical protein
LVLRYVTQVHPHARPRRRTAAHGVDEDVVDGEVRGGFGMAGFPAFESRERFVLVLRFGDGDERVFRARRGDAGRLAVLLLVVRRPGRVAGGTRPGGAGPAVLLALVAIG